MSESRNGFRASAADERAREATLQRFVPEVRTALDNAPDVRAWPPSWHDDEWVNYFYHSSLPADPRPRPPACAGRAPRSRRTARREWGRSDRRRNQARRQRPGVAAHAGRRRGPRQSARRRRGHARSRLRHHRYAPLPGHRARTGHHPCSGRRPRGRSGALWPGIGDPSAGRDVGVSVVDTGLLSGASAWAPWIEGVRPDTSADIEDPDQLKVNSMKHEMDGFADPYAGHGTFVSGVIRCVAPASLVMVERILGVSGFARRSGLIQQIHDALAHLPDIISMSAGCYTRQNVPPLAFQTLWEERLSQFGGVVLVAAAGNQAATTPFWPAAFPWCVGVGSMSRDGQRRSWFSNHGAWVNVYAPGEEIVNAYAHMKYKTVADGEVRDTSAGIVSWSGTSFSTPIVAGLIAARMSRTGENARQAADTLLAAARSQFRPGVGPRLFP